jgi:hypothetical protein
MNVSYEYAYFLGSLYFIPVWAWLYLRLPQHRKFMLLGGISYMWLGFGAEYFWWVKDWWHPMTITGTVVGVEDMIMSFTHVSILIFIYKYVFGKDMEENKNFKWKEGAFRFLSIIILLFGTIVILTNYLKVNSSISTALGLFLASFFMIYKRKELFFSAIGSAFLLVVLTLPLYMAGRIFSPEAVKMIWDSRMSGIVFLGYPIEDIVCYVSWGFFFGVVYEFVADRKTINLQTNNFKKDITILFSFVFHPEKIEQKL